MQIRYELKVWMVIFLSIYLVMTFGVIQLLSRMTPTIERILHENVYSVTAVEEMLAAAADGAGGDRRSRFEAALEKARNNITEPEEGEIIREIDGRWEEAFNGDGAAMSDLVHLLQRLGQVNRDSMRRADEEAKRQGSGGAWAAVMLGFSGFLISLYAMRRLARRFLDPLEEIHSVLQAFQQGKRFRRCTLQHSSPEFREVGEAVNRLLDSQWSSGDEGFHARAQLDRMALLNLMDDQKTPLAVLDTAGHLHAVNTAMEQILDGAEAEEVRALLGRVASGRTDLPEGARAVKLKAGGWICALPADEAPYAR